MGQVTSGHSREKLERAAEFRRTMTPSESALWERLRANRFRNLHFRRQVVMEGFILDFYCHARRLAVELDGAVHLKTREYDAERDAILGGAGIQVLRFTNEEVEKDPGRALARIWAAARRQAR